ncbi:hypothetical protein PCASD_17625 [Puccinia coronata f. sp. avenae]|uniref:Uncharacterized protein n=1 Tax=Puccinia coronata f. sp. avenae TaxID=200324 RepID=A0A2N5TTV8_9BASI|nr:hypothetical protein PCASD_17625 [Puccinia coronata f. sp. avenae]
MCEGLLQRKTDGGQTHEEKVDKLRRRFPKAKKWIDWWTVADVESMLFLDRRKMIEYSPEGDDSLPETTNAQESMHRLYYMFSSGKKPLLVGMIELFAFVKALEQDWRSVMKGTPIEYRTQPKNQIGVAQSVGLKIPTKCQRAAINDGRPPNTSAALEIDSIPPKKKAKLGRPKNATNIDWNPYSTFVSYVASDDEETPQPMLVTYSFGVPLRNLFSSLASTSSWEEKQNLFQHR